MGNVNKVDIVTMIADLAAAMVNQTQLTSITPQIVATFADLAPLAVGTKIKIFIVTTDETNGNIQTLYVYDGVKLNWVPMTAVSTI